MLETSIGRLRAIGILEGISFLLLLGIAMPLKYMFDMPLAVKYTGWAHGALFVLYIAMIGQVAMEQKWSFGKIILAVLASVLPFGPFIFDAKYLKQQEQPETAPKKVKA